MADDYTTPATYSDNVVVNAANLNTYVRNNVQALKAAIAGDASASTTTSNYHYHKQGTLASIPDPATTGGTGRTYYATDLGAWFIQVGTTWRFDHAVESVCEHAFYEFMDIPTNWQDISGAGGVIMTLSTNTSLTAGSTYFRVASGPINSRGGMSAPGTLHRIWTNSRLPMFFETRVKISSAARTNGEIFVGLMATLPTAGTNLGTDTGAHRIGFQKHDTASEADWQGVRTDGTGPGVTTLAGFKDASYHRFELRYTSSGIQYFVDGTSFGAVTTLIPTAALRLVFYQDSTAAQTNTLDIDYVRFAAAR